ncbi:hypothetical protein WISP_01556 [Willisornis vidua]|uniref:Uncharacterized protein n=1 Tax=Willisornis vidua TaxID=1566151 RepID=A0ABQ9DUC5_9PASS|nr:hypothetical protein WISP_01556 [Willisornis vidua]
MSQFSFGAAAPGGAFSLGAPKAAATTTTSGFSFSAPAPAASGGFSFGSAAAAPGGSQPAGPFFSRPGSAAQPGFSFGAAPAAAAFPLGPNLWGTDFNSSHECTHSNTDHKYQPGTHPVLWNQAWSDIHSCYNSLHHHNLCAGPNGAHVVRVCCEFCSPDLVHHHKPLTWCHFHCFHWDSQPRNNWIWIKSSWNNSSLNKHCHW